MSQSKLTTKELYDIYRAGSKSIDTFAENLWNNTLSNPSSDLYLGQSYLEGLKRAALELSSLGFYFDPMHNPDPLIQKYLQERGGNFITWLSNTGKKEFADLLIEGYTNTGSFQEFDRLFKDKYPFQKDYKSLQIWVTENNVAANKAAYDVYGAYNIPGFEIINATHPCEMCITEAMYTHRYNEAPPPYHVFGWVYDDPTYILLKDKGWTLTKDVEIEDIALSLNPETKEIEEVEVVDTFVNLFDGDLVHLYNHNADILVTSDHKIVYQSNWDSKHNKDKPYRFKEIKDFGTSDRLPRTGIWKGKYIDKVNIGSLEIDIVTFCNFMGYFLAEGSANVKGDIIISQMQENKKDIMFNNLVGFPLNITKTKYGLYVSRKNGSDLVEYLKQFGKCNEKYVPSIIKDLTPELINIFLDAYLLGDGTIQKENVSTIRGKPLKSKSIRKWYSTSEKIIEDISELIIKVGNRPAFSICNKKGTMTKFNRENNYSINFDVLLVSERTSKYTTGQKIKKEFIPYKGKAVGITLERNHTVFVKRNNKVSIIANCQCLMRPVFEIEHKKDPNGWKQYMTETQKERFDKNYEKFNPLAKAEPINYTHADMKRAIDEAVKKLEGE